MPRPLIFLSPKREYESYYLQPNLYAFPKTGQFSMCDRSRNSAFTTSLRMPSNTTEPPAAVTAIAPNMEVILLAPDEAVMEVPATAAPVVTAATPAMAVMAFLATEVTKPTEQPLLAPITPYVSTLHNGLNRSNREDVSAVSTPVLEVR